MTDPRAVSPALAAAGRQVDACLTAAGHPPPPPKYWQAPTPEEIEAARRMDRPNRDITRGA